MHFLVDATGDAHRSSTSDRIAASAYYLPVIPTSGLLGNQPSYRYGIWTLDAVGGGYGNVLSLGNQNPFKPTANGTVALAPLTSGFVGVPYTSDGSELQSWAPPALWDMIAVGPRLIAIDATDRRRILYTKEKQVGLEYEWAAEMELFLPASAGWAVGLAEFDGNVVVICESGVYVIGGDGYGNTLTGSNFSAPRLVSSERTSRHKRNMVISYAGGVFWEGVTAYCRLITGWQVQRIPGIRPVDGLTTAFHLGERNEVWLTGSTASRVWNYRLNRWSNGKVDNAGQRAFMEHDGKLLYEQAGGTALWESGPGVDDDSGITYKSPWIAPAGLNGKSVMRELAITGLLLDQNEGARIDVNIYQDFRAATPARTLVFLAAELLTKSTFGRMIVLPIGLKGDVSRSVAVSISVQHARFLPVEARLDYSVTEGDAKPKAGPPR
jgi:hypothetical protein